LSLVLLFGLFGLFAPGALADKDDEMWKHYQRGLTSYKSGQYEDAIVEFRAAYLIKQLPRLLLNLGQAHRKLGHAREALDCYQSYLQAVPEPEPDIKTDLVAYIASTRAMLDAADRMKAQKPAPENGPAGTGPPPPDRPAPDAPRKDAPDLLPPTEPAKAPPAHRRTALWIGLGVAGVVVLSGVIAGVAVAARPAGETTLSLVNLR
jgi:tetratricopeptide (TPR) repeat protein